MKSPIFKVVLEREKRCGVDVSDISVYICLIDIRDGSSKPVYGGVDCLMIGTDSYAYLIDIYGIQCDFKHIQCIKKLNF